MSHTEVIEILSMWEENDEGYALFSDYLDAYYPDELPTDEDYCISPFYRELWKQDVELYRSLLPDTIRDTL